MADQESKPSRRKAEPAPAEPETVAAFFGDEGEDPHEVGFVGVKPADEPDTLENVVKRAQ
jgi:hypothetical protein